jgi:hypothetical protein
VLPPVVAPAATPAKREESAVDVRSPETDRKKISGIPPVIEPGTSS